MQKNFLNEERARMSEEAIHEREELLCELDALKKRHHETAQHGGKNFSRYLLKVDLAELYHEDLFMYWLLAHEIPKRLEGEDTIARQKELKAHEEDLGMYGKKLDARLEEEFKRHKKINPDVGYGKEKFFSEHPRENFRLWLLEEYGDLKAGLRIGQRI